MNFLFRALVAILGLVLLAEFSLRLNGYHMTVKYQREGDLLFAPSPNQTVTEKIALTPTRVNNYGVRGVDFRESDLAQKTTVLCLGDSIVYGYGVDDSHTYPDFLQKTLDQNEKGEYLVVNAGVNAYPIAMMRERYRNLLSKGIKPKYVVIGYSMNEGLLGRIAEGDEALKSAFEKRIILKNTLRSIGLYNLVIENWARSYYDRYKGRFIPGTNQVSGPTSGSAELANSESQGPELSNEEFYAQSLAKLAETLKENSNIEEVIAVCSAAHNAETELFDTNSRFQAIFKKAAQQNGWTLISSDEVLHKHAPDNDLSRFFIDRCHMNADGNKILGTRLGHIILNSANDSIHP